MTTSSDYSKKFERPFPQLFARRADRKRTVLRNSSTVATTSPWVAKVGFGKPPATAGLPAATDVPASAHLRRDAPYVSVPEGGPELARQPLVGSIAESSAGEERAVMVPVGKGRRSLPHLPQARAMSNFVLWLIIDLGWRVGTYSQLTWPVLQSAARGKERLWEAQVDIS